MPLAPITSSRDGREDPGGHRGEEALVLNEHPASERHRPGSTKRCNRGTGRVRQAARGVADDRLGHLMPLPPQPSTVGASWAMVSTAFGDLWRRTRSSSGPSRSAPAWVRVVVGPRPCSAAGRCGSRASPTRRPLLRHLPDSPPVEGPSAALVERQATHPGADREDHSGGTVQGPGVGRSLVAAESTSPAPVTSAIPAGEMASRLGGVGEGGEPGNDQGGSFRAPSQSWAMAATTAASVSCSRWLTPSPPTSPARPIPAS